MEFISICGAVVCSCGVGRAGGIEPGGRHEARLEGSGGSGAESSEASARQAMGSRGG